MDFRVSNSYVKSMTDEFQLQKKTSFNVKWLTPSGSPILLGSSSPSALSPHRFLDMPPGIMPLTLALAGENVNSAFFTYKKLKIVFNRNILTEVQ